MVRGVLLDVDGVLTVSWKALPGAVDTIGWLRDNAMPFRLVTNTSSKSRGQIARLLGDSGMPVDPGHIVTAVTSAARLLTDRYPGRRCLVVNDGDLTDDLSGVETVGVDRAADAGVVLLGGAGPAVGYAELNAVFRLASAGVPVVALHRNTRFQTADGPALDMGAFIVGLETAAGIDVTVVGKPAPEFYAAALAGLGVDAADAVMVGDDISSDVIGAQDAGISGVLVRTGKFRDTDLLGDHGTPDHIIDGIGDLPALLDRLRAGG
jgi:HAD superfamily hydrolase (TIGR01458 family)